MKFNPFTIQSKLEMSANMLSQDFIFYFKCSLRETYGSQMCYRKHQEPHVALKTEKRLQKKKKKKKKKKKQYFKLKN